MNALALPISAYCKLYGRPYRLLTSKFGSVRITESSLSPLAWLFHPSVAFAVLSGSLLYANGWRARPLAILISAGLIAALAIVLAWRRPPKNLARQDRTADSGNEETVRSLLQANVTLAASEARYRAFFDHAEDSLCDVEVTPEGGFICLNISPHAEAVMGITAAAVRGLTPEQILGPEAGGRLTAALVRCMDESGLRYEENWATVRGSRLTDTIMVPLRDERAPSGPYVRILCSMRDITDRRHLEMQLAQGQKLQALGQLAGGIAHDFNNVLQAIEGGASLIALRAGERDAVARLARTVLDAAVRGSSITRRLLAFARRDEMRAEAVDTAKLLLELREVLASTLGAGISVCVSLPPNLPSVQADKGLLETAVVNLATNARDAMPQGGTLTLNARAEIVVDQAEAPLQLGAYIRFDVTDTGDGMDAVTLARATEPFFTTKPRGQGTGLGLSMVRGFAEQSDGALAMSSVKGHGTTISLWLPQALVAATEVSSNDTCDDVPLASRTAPRVLVVDDDPPVREMICETLQMAGYDAFGAADATAALPLIKQMIDLDLLITDFSMPGLNGIGLIRDAQRHRPGLPAILMTGYAGDVDGFSGESTANVQFVLLRKPVSSRDMFAQIASLISGAVPLEPTPRQFVDAE
jgi:PAS domain S-box-containing protein